jgi:hypothetical protein
MKWVFLAAAVASVGLLFGQVHQYFYFSAFGIAFVNFATFCLQYEDPAHRARRRIEDRLSRLKPGGIDADELARLRSATPAISAEDRAVRWNVMTLLHVATGIASLGLCAWGIMLRMG